MDRETLKGMTQGISVAVPAPFDDDYNLDLAKAADLTRLWVADGLGTNTAFIKLASAWGQGPDLSDAEWPHLLRTVVDAGGDDVVVMQGLRSRGTVLVIDDAKRAQDLGAVSLQIELPFHHGPNQDDYVRYFTDISDAIDIGIMIYNTYWFGCAPLTAETMLRLADAEHVVAIKWNMPEGHDYDDMQQFSHIFNVLDNSGDMVRCHRNGGRGFVSAFASAYAAPELRLWQLFEERRYDEAQAEMDRNKAAIGPVSQKVGQRSGSYRLAKGMMDIMGRSSGPPRPPTQPLNAEELADLEAALKGLGWPVPEREPALA